MAICNVLTVFLKRNITKYLKDDRSKDHVSKFANLRVLIDTLSGPFFYFLPVMYAIFYLRHIGFNINDHSTVKAKDGSDKYTFDEGN